MKLDGLPGEKTVINIQEALDGKVLGGTLRMMAGRGHGADRAINLLFNRRKVVSRRTAI